MKRSPAVLVLLTLALQGTLLRAQNQAETLQPAAAQQVPAAEPSNAAGPSQLSREATATQEQAGVINVPQQGSALAGDAGGFARAVLRMLVSLAIVLGVLLLLAKLLPRWLQGSAMARLGKQGQLQVVDTLRLGPAHTVHLVRLGERLMVLAVSAAGVQLVCDVPAKGQDAEPSPQPPVDFASVLRQAPKETRTAGSQP